MPAARPRLAADAADDPLSPPDAPFVDDYLPALLARASARISAEFHRVVKDAGLTVPQWRVLATLSDRRPHATGELARIALLTQPTTTRLLDGLQARGEIERADDRDDRRITRVRITPRGERRVAGLVAHARRHEATVLAPLGADAGTTLKAALRVLLGDAPARRR